MSKKKTMLVAAFVVMGIAALGLAAAVYAKYISSISKTGTATVAKWAFTTDNREGEVTCTLDQTYNADTLVAGKIAPGTSGKCPITVSNATSEVGIRYDIKPSAVANQPTNLRFYSDAGHQHEITTASDSDTIFGTVAPGQSSPEVYVYWNWPYQDGTDDYDAADTEDGEAAKTMTMTFTVTGTQVEPAQ